MNAIIDVHSRIDLKLEHFKFNGQRVVQRTIGGHQLPNTGALRYNNSDQGAQYTSGQYIDVLKGKITSNINGWQGKGPGNIYIERFWSSINMKKI